MDKLLGAFIFLKARLSEPSTHAALASLGAIIHVNLDPGQIQQYVDLASIAFGMMGFFVKEAKPLTSV